MGKNHEKNFGGMLKYVTVGNKKIKKVTKITAPITGVFGVLMDFLSPMAPLAPIVFILLICIFFYCFFFKVKPIIKSTGFDSAIENKFTHAATFSLVGSLIMLLFWGGSLIYPDEGVVAGNFSAVKDFQQRVLGTMDEISEKQDVIIEKQDKMADDVTDIKEIMTGEAEIKQLSSTEDYSTFEDVNVRTEISDQKTIAILYFDNSGGNAQLDALKKGLADMLISDLSNLQMLRVVEREKLEQVMSELKLSSGREFDAATRQKLGKLLGAETILFGSYFEMMGQFRMDARIVKTETGEILKSEGVSGITENFMKLEKQLVWKIARGLDVRFDEKEEAAVMASESVPYEATLAYSEGLELYDNGDKEAALEKFNEAVSLAPDFDRPKKMINRLHQT